MNIQCHVSISNGVTVGDGTFIGPGVRILNDKYMNGLLQPPKIGRFVRLGGGTLVLPGVEIGDNSFVGAGIKVTKSLSEGSMMLR